MDVVYPHSKEYPVFRSLVCIDINTQKWKGGKKRERAERICHMSDIRFMYDGWDQPEAETQSSGVVHSI